MFATRASPVLTQMAWFQSRPGDSGEPVVGPVLDTGATGEGLRHPWPMANLTAALRPRPQRIALLSRRASFWTVAFAFLTVTALSTAPSPLYGLYARRDNFSSFTTTIVYGVYVVGLVASLLLAGHVSDWYGRRTVLIPGLAIAIAAVIVFIAGKSLPAVFAGRILTGIALGASVATATAYLSDLDVDAAGAPTRRAGIVATIANVGGLAVGPLVAGLLAEYVSDPLTLPYVVVAAGLGLGLVGVAVSVEGRPPISPLHAYRPQRLKAPSEGRGQFAAAISGAFLSFAVFGLFAGLAVTLLTRSFHHRSPALAGLAIFMSFGCGLLAQISTFKWPAQRSIVVGIGPAIIGLAIMVVSAWTHPPSLAAFLISGVVAGAGGGLIFRGSLALVIASSPAEVRAGAVATYFSAAYLGIAVPVVGAGAVLQFASPRVTLFAFGIVVAAGLIAATPILFRPHRAL
jgi:MFS family permease